MCLLLLIIAFKIQNWQLTSPTCLLIIWYSAPGNTIETYLVLTSFIHNYIPAFYLTM